MPDHQITIEVASAIVEEAPIRLTDLIGSLTAVREALRQADDEHKPRIVWQVKKVTSDSPVTAIFEPVPDPVQRERGARVVRRFFDYAFRIQTGLYEGISRNVLEAFRDLAAPVDSGRVAISVRNGRAAFEISKGLSFEIKAVLAPENTARGSVKGQLEFINLHGERNLFRIYPVVGPRYIECHFPVDLTAEAKDAIGKGVRISGRLHYRTRSRLPYRIDVKHIEELPADSSLPTIMDVRGIAPEATGDVPSEQFVRSLRIGRETQE